MVIQSSFAEVYAQVVDRSVVLHWLEQYARGLGGAVSSELKELVQHAPRLKDMLSYELFFADLSDEQLDDLVFQTRTTQDRS